MKRLFFIPFITLATVLSLYANGQQEVSSDEPITQDVYEYSWRGEDYYSITSQLSAGILTNELDAAFKADEETSGPGFSDLSSLYFFGGVDNLEGLGNEDSSSRFSLGIYFPGMTSFSCFIKARHIDAGMQIFEEEITEGVTTRLHDVIYFREIDDEIQFLFNRGDFTTGLRYKINLEDNRRSIDNYRIRSSDPSLANVSMDKNGSLTSHNFLIPLFWDSTDIQNYLEIGFTYALLDSSLRNDLEFTDYTDISRYFIPELNYTMHLPSFDKYNARNQMNITLAVQSAVVHHEHYGTIEGAAQQNLEREDFNMDATIGIEQALYIQPNDFVTLGFKPTFKIFYSSRPIYPVVIDSSISWGGYFECPSVLEFKPENWFAGFSIGVVPHIGYAWRSGYEYSHDSDLTYYESSFETMVSHSYSLFFPLPGGYRMDVSVGYQGLWDFDDLKMQIIIPLGSKKTDSLL